LIQRIFIVHFANEGTITFLFIQANAKVNQANAKLEVKH
jgi:hypothetical protein